MTKAHLQQLSCDTHSLCHMRWHLLVDIVARPMPMDAPETSCAIPVQNLLYMTRLGLWGPSTAFPNRLDFVKLLNARGVGASCCQMCCAPAQEHSSQLLPVPGKVSERQSAQWQRLPSSNCQHARHCTGRPRLSGPDTRCAGSRCMPECIIRKTLHPVRAAQPVKP